MDTGDDETGAILAASAISALVEAIPFGSHALVNSALAARGRRVARPTPRRRPAERLSAASFSTPIRRRLLGTGHGRSTRRGKRSVIRPPRTTARSGVDRSPHLARRIMMRGSVRGGGTMRLYGDRLRSMDQAERGHADGESPRSPRRPASRAGPRDARARQRASPGGGAGALARDSPADLPVVERGLRATSRAGRGAAVLGAGAAPPDPGALTRWSHCASSSSSYPPPGRPDPPTCMPWPPA